MNFRWGRIRLPVEDGRLVDTELLREVSLQHLQSQAPLAEMVPDGLRLNRNTDPELLPHACEAQRGWRRRVLDGGGVLGSDRGGATRKAGAVGRAGATQCGFEERLHGRSSTGIDREVSLGKSVGERAWRRA
jgi:hypothetical protein